MRHGSECQLVVRADSRNQRLSALLDQAPGEAGQDVRRLTRRIDDLGDALATEAVGVEAGNTVDALNMLHFEGTQRLFYSEPVCQQGLENVPHAPNLGGHSGYTRGPSTTEYNSSPCD